jgi:DNA-binding response OmpR family regulator
MSTILLVDDETRMLDLLALYLAPYRYKCIKAQSGKVGLRYLEKEKVDLVILDIMMPDLDGWTTCQKLREFSDIPIIMLTARSETVDVIKGLKCGADDYVSKPFQEEELLARIEALLRRTQQTDSPLFFKGLRWEPESAMLTYQNHPLFVTPKEFSIIGLFLKNPHKVFLKRSFVNGYLGIKCQYR